MLGFGVISKKLFGSANDKKVKQAKPLVEKINVLEKKFQRLSDDEIKQKTAELRNRIASGEQLDSLLPEAFANVREAAKRSIGLRAFDTQLIGAIFLHQGNMDLWTMPF